ncbi:MAG: ABC transporter substrate binding protein, partial [Nitrospirota bacterium]
MKISLKKQLLILTAALICFCFVSAAHSADVLIIGDTELQPVSDVITAIDGVIDNDSAVKSAKEVRDDLNDIVLKEKVKVVIALGRDAVDIAIKLPESVSVIYGLIIKPPDTKRRNITGVYMWTPVNEYLSIFSKYFPGIKKVGMTCLPECVDFIKSTVDPSWLEIRAAKNSYEFIEKIASFKGKVDAILLLPDKDLISSKAVEDVYLFSFTNKIPVVGISEKYVKTGSLFSLVFDEAAIGRQIGRLALDVLMKGSAAGMPPLPPDKFKLYIN